MTFPTGSLVRVTSSATYYNGMIGTVVDCSQQVGHDPVSDNRSCVIMEAGQHLHLLDSELVERENANGVTPPTGRLENVVQATTISVAEAARRVSVAFATLGSVGTTNNEGETMPVIEPVVIAIEHTSATRNAVFDELGTRNTLMNQLDPEAWLTALAALEEACGPIQWSVTPGAMSSFNYPETILHGTTTRVENVSWDSANEFLAVASNNRLQLALHPNNPNRAGIQPTSDLEARAWRIYAGTGTYMNISDPYGGMDTLVNLRSLRDLLSYYTEFLNLSSRRDYFRAALRERMAESIRGDVAPVVTQEWDQARANKFEGFVNNVKSRLVVEANPFLKLPILPHKTLTSRTWGIEIEAVDIEGVSTPEYWELKSDGSLRSLHVESMLSRVKDPEYTGIPLVTDDGSEAPQVIVAPVPPSRSHDSECAVYDDEGDDSGDCDCGLWAEEDTYSDQYEEYVRATQGAGYGARRTQTGEWNSPVLRSFHSRGLKYLTGALEMRDTNNSAGVHVHVAAGDLSPEQAIKVGIIYTALEPLFEKEYKRNDDVRSYCKSVDTPELIARFQQMKDVKARKQGAEAMRFNSRYWTVNLASLQRHHTIEFRAMGPIYNYEHLIRWAYLVREIVNIAKADVPQSAWAKVRTIEDLVTLFSKYGKETPTPDWATPEPADDSLDKVIAGLGSETRRVPHTARLIPGNSSSPRLVNDDYSNDDTYMLGQRGSNTGDEEATYASSGRFSLDSIFS